MRLIDAFTLGAVQGISEWLPVSSSGHLVIFRRFFGLEGGVAFDVFLHLPALFIILIFFRGDILKVGRAFFSLDKKSHEFKTAVYISYATAVTIVAGIFLKPHIEQFTVLAVLPYTFLFNSLMLFFSKRDGESRLNTKKTLFIGLMQGLALLPGISRSGSTISAGKIAGLKSEEAFSFSFLMAIPAIAGAMIYDMNDLGVLPVPFLLVGFVTAFVLGLLSLYFLKRIVLSGRFYLFGFYTLALSLFLLIMH